MKNDERGWPLSNERRELEYELSEERVPEYALICHRFRSPATEQNKVIINFVLKTFENKFNLNWMDIYLSKKVGRVLHILLCGIFYFWSWKTEGKKSQLAFDRIFWIFCVLAASWQYFVLYWQDILRIEKKISKSIQS